MSLSTGPEQTLTMTMIKIGLGSPGGTVSSTSFFENSSMAEAWTMVDK